MKTLEEAIKVLTRPLEASEIEWKVVSSRGGYTTIVPYIDARAVMDRLDAAFGPFGWEVRYRTVTIGEHAGVVATLRIRHPETGEWVEKEDGAGPSDMEPFKGGLSNALKRVATAWGIGRELYSYPTVRITGEYRYIPRAVLKGLEELLARGELPEVVTLNPDGSLVRPSWREE